MGKREAKKKQEKMYIYFLLFFPGEIVCTHVHVQGGSVCVPSHSFGHYTMKCHQNAGDTSLLLLYGLLFHMKYCVRVLTVHNILWYELVDDWKRVETFTSFGRPTPDLGYLFKRDVQLLLHSPPSRSICCVKGSASRAAGAHFTTRPS